MNTFYSLRCSDERSYSFEIFDYEGSYNDLITAVRSDNIYESAYDVPYSFFDLDIDLMTSVRSDNIYDLADDFAYSFYNMNIGEMFAKVMNNIDGIEDFVNDRLMFTNKSSDVALRERLQVVNKMFEDIKFYNSVLKSCCDYKIRDIVDKVKIFEKDNVIPYTSIKSNLHNLSVAYNVCVKYDNDNKVTYYFEQFSDVLQFDLYQMAKNEINIKRCENCGKYFVPKARADEIYCDNINASGKTCRQIGYENKVNNDEILREYRKIYKTQNARKQRNKDNIKNIDDKFKKWHITAKDILKKCQNNEIDLNTMMYQINKTDWMEGE